METPVLLWCALLWGRSVEHAQQMGFSDLNIEANRTTSRWVTDHTLNFVKTTAWPLTRENVAPSHQANNALPLGKSKAGLHGISQRFTKKSLTLRDSNTLF